jgi:hypothetical protein
MFRLKYGFFLMLFVFLSVSVIQAQSSGEFTGTIDDTTYYGTIDLPDVPEGATITVDAQATSGNLDLVVILFYLNGIWAAESDDREPGNLNPYLIYENAPAGDYRIIVTRYGVEEGESTGDFVALVDVQIPESVALTSITPETVVDWEAAGYPVMEPRPLADWTILAYYDADNNLEAGIMFDMDEFERGGGSTESVRVVVLLDRAEGFDTSNGDWTDTRLYEAQTDVSNDALTVYPPTIDSPVLAEMGELDMGDEMNLLNFLVWGMETYPAERYIVSLNNHGGAWSGIIWDDSSPTHNNLTLPKLNAAFGRALQIAGRDRFDLLINDACLMSSMEYFASIAPYFNITYSSPEIMNNPGFDMALLLEQLNANPDVDLAELGQVLADKYMQDMILSVPAIEPYMGVAVTDLREFEPLVTALNAFTSYVNSEAETLVPFLGRVRANTYTYSIFSQGTENIDLGDFMGRIAAGTTNDELQTAALNVIDSLDHALLYSAAGDLLSQETYFYNIFFPQSADRFNPRYIQQSPLTGWVGLLRTYFTTLNSSEGGTFGSDVMSAAPQVNITNVFPVETNIYAPVVISMEVVGNNISHGEFTADYVLDDGSSVRLSQRRIVTENVRDDGTVEYINYWHPGVDDFDFTWEDRVAYVTDGTNRYPELVIVTDRISSMPGLYQFPNSTQQVFVDVVFDEYGDFSSMIARGGDISGFATIRPQAGGTFQALTHYVTPDGQVQRVPGNSYQWTDGGISWENGPAPTGVYNLGFVVQGFNGETGFSSTQVSVNHENVNEAYQGYLDIDWGFNLVYPSDWTDMVYFPNQEFESANNPAGDSFIYVYPVLPSSPDLETVAQEALAQFGITLDPETFNAITIGNADALEFTYLWDNGNGVIYDGRAFAVYQEPLGLGLVFASETLNGADNLPMYEMLRDNVILFDATQVTAADTGRWDTQELSENATFPVLQTWAAEPLVSADWTFYFAESDQTSPTFIAVTEQASDDAVVTMDAVMTAFQGNSPSVEIRTEDAYYGEINTWQQVIYTRTNNYGDPATGGVFVTVMDGVAHVIWFEAPTELIESVAADFLITVDGYTIEGVYE